MHDQILMLAYYCSCNRTKSDIHTSIWSVQQQREERDCDSQMLKLWKVMDPMDRYAVFDIPREFQKNGSIRAPFALRLANSWIRSGLRDHLSTLNLHDPCVHLTLCRVAFCNTDGSLQHVLY